VRLTADEPRMVATVHHRNSAGLARVGLAFTAAHDPARHGQPVNNEPHRCAKIEWFPADILPSNTYPYTSACVAAWRDGAALRLSGWQSPPARVAERPDPALVAGRRNGSGTRGRTAWESPPSGHKPPGPCGPILRRPAGRGSSLPGRWCCWQAALSRGISSAASEFLRWSSRMTECPCPT
jgi:hypothetical protein